MPDYVLARWELLSPPVDAILVSRKVICRIEQLTIRRSPKPSLNANRRELSSSKLHHSNRLLAANFTGAMRLN